MPFRIKKVIIKPASEEKKAERERLMAAAQKQEL